MSGISLFFPMNEWQCAQSSKHFIVSSSCAISKLAVSSGMPSMSSQQEEACPSGVQGPPACYLILYNVAKKHNVGTLARCCTAFGVKEICLVGQRHFNVFGSHGADLHVDFRHFHTLEDCVAHLKEVQHCEIIGIEITPDAKPVQGHPFKGPTAFMLGNEGQGLSDKQKRLCDSFVYIPQYGCGTASLNVAVAASIILHHFAVWAGYGEREREGAKFIVADRPARTRAKGVAGNPEEIRAARHAGQADAQEAEAQEEWASQAMHDILG